jgi:hypothetical protein
MVCDKARQGRATTKNEFNHACLPAGRNEHEELNVVAGPWPAKFKV